MEGSFDNMCGIIGYVGSANAVERALVGLRRFEPRGYDATGIGLATLGKGPFQIVKSDGPTSELRKALASIDMPANPSVVIGHSRWATHGAKTQVNAHPHVSSSGQTMGVHNGTIHNHAELRAWLRERGYVFASETDTEVIMSLIDEARKRLRDASPMEAMLDALRRLNGTWALAICFLDRANELYVAASGSSLVVGFGINDMFVGSEPAGLFAETNRFIRFRDGECGRVTRDGLFDQLTLVGEAWNRPIETIEPRIKNEPVCPPGRRSMQFEIDQTPTVLRAMLEGFDAQLDGETGERLAECLRDHPVRRLLLTGCGSAFNAARFAERIWPTDPDSCAFEVRACLASDGGLKGLRLDSEDDVLLAVSQSGTTYDTIQAVRRALESGLEMFALVNEAHVTLDALVHGALYTDAGREDSVAATKTFVLQCAALLALAVRYGGAPESDGKALTELPDQIAKVISRLEAVVRVTLAPIIAEAKTVFVLGQEMMVPMAYESALKLQEVARSRALGLPMGELKHGPLALIDKEAAIIMLASDDETLRQAALLTLSEMRNCEPGPIIVIASVQAAPFYKGVADHVLVVPNAPARTLPILHVVVMQLLALHAAEIQGFNPDRPKHLAKTVTVG